MARSLQEITDAWGNWMVHQHGGGKCRFTSSTRYSDHSELNAYHGYQTTAAAQTISYDTGSPLPKPKQLTSVITTYRNDSSLEQTFTYNQSETVQRNFTWSVTESISISESITIQAGLPEIAEISSTTTVDVSLSSTQGASYDKSKTWSVDQPFNVAAHSLFEAKMIITVQDYNIKWSCDVSLIGHVAIWFEDKVALNPNDYHWLWFIPIQQVISDCQTHNIIDTSNYKISGNGVLTQAQGVFAGSQGISYNVDTKETSLQPQGELQEPMATSSSFLPSAIAA